MNNLATTQKFIQCSFDIHEIYFFKIMNVNMIQNTAIHILGTNNLSSIAFSF